MRPIPAWLAALTIIAGAAALGVAGLALVAWLGFARHEFGADDPRVVLFVRGTLTHRIGLLEPERGSIRYESEGPDGPGVGFLYTRYRTRAEPAVVIAHADAGCRRAGWTVLLPSADHPPEPGTLFIACEKDDLGFGVTVKGREVLVREDVP
jgi:hypothetical protein